jgi:hypothetical protein
MAEAQTTERVSFALSQEELYVLLTYLKAPAPMELEDFETRVVGGMSPDQKVALLRVAERGLLAREYLWLSEDRTLSVNPAVARVVQVCAQPEQTWLILHRQRDQAPMTQCFHRQAELFVALTTPLEGMHHCVVFPDDRLMQQTMFDLVAAGNAQAVACAPGTVPMDVFAEMTRDSQPFERASAEKKLADAGLAPDTASRLAQSLEMLQSITIITRIAHRPEREPTPDAGATVIADGSTLWLLEQEQAGRLSVRSGSARDLSALVKRVAGESGTSRPGNR